MNCFTDIDAAQLRKVVGLFDNSVETDAAAAFAAVRGVARRNGIPLVSALGAVLGRPAAKSSREQDSSPDPVPPTATSVPGSPGGVGLPA